MLDDRPPTLMHPHLIGLPLTELHIIRHVIDRIKAAIDKVLEFLLAAPDAHDVVDRVLRNFRMRVRERAAVPAAAVLVALATRARFISTI
jgi:hypothetical protein